MITEISTREHMIICQRLDTKERTKFVLYRTKNGQTTIYHGEHMDSEDDFQIMREMNESLSKFKRETKRKLALSYWNSRDIVLD